MINLIVIEVVKVINQKVKDLIEVKNQKMINLIVIEVVKLMNKKMIKKMIKIMKIQF